MDKKEIIQGAKWSMIERLSSQGAQFLLSIIIARLVLPSEYGIIAMLSIFLAVAQVFIDSGFTYSLLQKQERTDKDFSTVFIFNTILAFVIYWVFFISAGVIADFYSEERLVLIIRVLFLVLIINSFSIVQRTRFQIALNFKIQAKISIVSIIASGIVAILLAYKGLGVWALIVQSLLGALITTICLWIFGTWKINMVFSKESFIKLFSFGIKILGTMLIDTIYINLYNLFIGKVYSPKDLGFYNRAFTLSQFPSRNLYNILNRVLFPVLCEQQNKVEQQTITFKKYIQLVSFFIFPLMLFLSFFAYPIVELILSPKWIPCAIYLSILSIAYMFFPIMASLFDLVNSQGYSKFALKAEIIKKTFGVLVILSTIQMGIIQLCIGALVTNLFDIVVMLYYTRKITPIGFSVMYKIITPILILALGSCAITYGLINFLVSSPFLQVILGLPTMVIIYMITAYVFKFSQIHLVLTIINKA